MSFEKHHHNEVLYCGHHLHRPWIVHCIGERSRNEITWKSWNSRRETSHSYRSNDQFERYTFFIIFWKYFSLLKKLWYFKCHLEFLIALFSVDQEREETMRIIVTDCKDTETNGKCYNNLCNYDYYKQNCKETCGLCWKGIYIYFVIKISKLAKNKHTSQ